MIPIERFFRYAPEDRLPGEWRMTLLNDPCVYCGAAPDGLDHIQAGSRRGHDGWMNRAPACEKCDQMKGAAPLWFFLLARRRAEERLKRKKRYRTQQHHQSAIRALTTAACIAFYKGEPLPKWLVGNRA